MDIVKYPRTRHIAGSRLQHGDHDLEIVRVDSLWGRPPRGWKMDA